MRRTSTLVLLLFMVLAQAVCAEDYDQWHKKRIEALTRPDGYLSLVGLEWLSEEPVAIDGVGEAWLEQDTVRIDLVEGYTLHGEPIESATLDSRKPEGDEILQNGTRSFYVVRRGPRTGLRIKDSQAPTRVGFAGVERFEIDPSWRLEGKLVKDAGAVDVASVVGVSTSEKSPGWAEIEVNGECRRMLLLGNEDSERFFLVFSDATAGDTTYSACRFLYVDRVGEDGLVLDFNKSYNPPCAFTEFATCPLPPDENVLPFPVPVGEKAPAH